MISLRILLVVFSLFCIANTRKAENKPDKGKDQENATLIFAHVVFRHGDRTILGSYPNDPWSDKSNWPEGLGQLTNIGIEQEYELGKYLRERYHSLLGNASYSNELVYVQSTDIDRTLMSAETVMAGLFPPQGDAIWNDELLWQPIPIYTTPKELEQIIYPGKPCPRLYNALRNYLSSSEIVELYAKHQQLFQYLEDNTGASIKNMSDVGALYDILWIEELKNKTLPEWTKEVFGAGTDFEQVAHQNFRTLTATTELARLSTGFLIRDILNRCSQKTKKSLSPDRSLWIYSAHDTTIANILNYFGHFNLHNPPYASSIHFELYQSNGQNYLQVSYRNSTGEMDIKFPFCDTKCSIEDLRQIYKEVIPTGEYDEECQLPLFVRAVEGKFICGADNCIIAFGCLGIIVPLIFIISWIIYSRRRGNIKMDSDDVMRYL